jgi:polysaccharide export outer membrane protein
MKRNSNLLLIGILLATAFVFSGCATDKSMPATAGDKSHSASVILREGDVLKITFPGSPNLDVTQQIRRDGKITMSLVGEVDASGQTPDALQKKLIELYAPQISSKEVNVAVQSSSFPVFVNGSVIHPGEILSDHPLTALEAIMKAGGFNYTAANLKAVKVIRTENGLHKNYVVNLKEVLDGKSDKSFYLQPGDIVFVPERFQMF